MSGETQRSESGWTVDTLKEYVLQRFMDNQKAVDAALVSQEKAIIKAETAAEKRFESVNEFRQQLNDQAQTLMPRQEYTVQHKALEDKIADINDRLNTMGGQSEGSKIVMGKIYAAIAAVGSILAIIILLANNVFK
jgi:hypothetical protein